MKKLLFLASLLLTLSCGISQPTTGNLTIANTGELKHVPIISAIDSIVIAMPTDTGGVKYYPMGSFAGQKFGFVVQTPKTFSKDRKYMLWIIGHGIGERGNGSQAALQKVYGWGGWGNIKQAVDKYEFITLYLNASVNYEKGEYQYGLQWALANLPVDTNNIVVLGHSLGSYGAGNYAFSDSVFARKINIWIPSASGPYSSTKIYKNISDNDIKIWGVTAVNDKASGTDPVYVTQLYDKVIALKPTAHVIITEFPATTWPTPLNAKGSTTAHNAVLGRLTGLTWSGITSDLIRGKTLTVAPKMNIYEWCLANPKGSIYQAPSDAYVGPVYPVIEQPQVDTLVASAPVPVKDTVAIPIPQLSPTPATPSKVTISGILIGADNKNPGSIYTQIHWSDGTITMYKAATGDRNAGSWIVNANGQLKVTIDYLKAANEVIGPVKK